MAGQVNSVWEREVAERLGNIEAKLDNIAQRLADGHDLHKNHGRRIATLERWRAYILGALDVIGLGVAVLVRVM